MYKRQNKDIKTQKELNNQGALELDNAVLELDNGALELADCSCWPTKPIKSVHGAGYGRFMAK